MPQTRNVKAKGRTTKPYTCRYRRTGPNYGWRIGDIVKVTYCEGDGPGKEVPYLGQIAEFDWDDIGHNFTMTVRVKFLEERFRIRHPDGWWTAPVWMIPLERLPKAEQEQAMLWSVTARLEG